MRTSHIATGIIAVTLVVMLLGVFLVVRQGTQPKSIAESIVMPDGAVVDVAPCTVDGGTLLILRDRRTGQLCAQVVPARSAPYPVK